MDRKYDMVVFFFDNLDEKRKDGLMLFDEYCCVMIVFYFEKREFEKVYYIIEVWNYFECKYIKLIGKCVLYSNIILCLFVRMDIL